MTQHLAEYLESYRDQNFNPDWSLRGIKGKPVFGNDFSNPLGEIAQRVEQLKSQANRTGRKLYILPVNSYYRSSIRGSFGKRDLVPDTYEFSKKFEIPVYGGVTKANYTGRDDLKHSYFVGDIPKNASFIVADDVFHTGRTVRDMAKFIESSGGTFEGFLWLEHAGDVCFNLLDENSKLMSAESIKNAYDKEPWYPIMYGSTHGIEAYKDAKKAWNELGDKKDEFIKQWELEAKGALGKIGLSLEQLTADELKSLLWKGRIFCDGGIFQESLTRTSPVESIKQGFEEVAGHISPPEVPNVDDIHEPQELEEFIAKSKRDPNEYVKSPEVGR